MPVNNQTLDNILRTIEQICSIPTVRYYRIGYTSWSAIEKRLQYPGKHLVILADKLVRTDALDLEKRLQGACAGIGNGACDRQSLNFAKYDPRRREGPYRRSHGANHAPENEEVHAVYIVWNTGEPRGARGRSAGGPKDA